MLKEAAAFYEDFLTVTDQHGHVVFVPSYSPENTSSNHPSSHTCINATMDVGAAKQLLRHAIAAAKELGRDEDLQTKWAELIAKMPPYEVGADGRSANGSGRTGRITTNTGMPPTSIRCMTRCPRRSSTTRRCVKAVGHTIRQRLNFHAKGSQMAYGIVLIGLAAAHTADHEQTQRAINLLAKDFWSTGMGSFHCPGTLFNMDISGGLPYLCASALVYSDPGLIRFFPARPPQWKSGSIKGLRLRGAITLKELTWDEQKAKAVLISDKDQTVTILSPGGGHRKRDLHAGIAAEVNLDALQEQTTTP